MNPGSGDDYVPTSIFAREITEEEEPVLQPGQANHILTYIGAFNPPHSGHIQILADGFYNTGPGMNIVSTLVLPTPNDSIQLKADRMAGEPAPPQLVLSVDERAELIASHLHEAEDLRGLECKTAVLAFPEYRLIPAYMRRAVELAAVDRLGVEFVSLKGPDHLFYDRPIKHPALEICTKIVFSEGTRENAEVWGEGGPRQLLGGWSPWYEVTWQAWDGVVRTVWEASHATLVGSKLRLLPEEDPAAIVDVSSTRIRNVIRNSDPRDGDDALVQKLRDSYAISPERLAEMLVDHAQ